MTKENSSKGYYWFVEFFNKSDGTLNKPAVLFTILTVVSSFFFLSSLLQFRFDMVEPSAMLIQFMGIYLLYALAMMILVLVIMSLEDKYVRLNINIFMTFYLIFMVPSINLVSLILFILVGLSLYYYYYTQRKESLYSRKVDIYRRVKAGLYMVIFMTTIALSVMFTSTFQSYTMNEIVDGVFTENSYIHDYMISTYDKYLDDEKFQLALMEIESQLNKSPRELFGALNQMPEDMQGLIAPEMLNLLNDDMTTQQYNLIKAQILDSIDSIRNVSKRDILVERVVNIGSSQLKKWIAPYEMYVKFYFGYSLFALLIILSPFLLILVSIISVLVFKLLKKAHVLDVITEKMDVETVRLL